MRELDVQNEYVRVRAEHFSTPHDDCNPDDKKMRAIFTAAVIIGINHALLSVKEKVDEASAVIITER